MNEIEFMNITSMIKADEYFKNGDYRNALEHYKIVVEDADKYNGDSMTVIMFATSAIRKCQECYNRI